VPMTITVLSFITLFLAIFTPSVAYIRKREERKDSSAWNERQQQLARAESDSAWILNKRSRSGIPPRE
jgi:hypothetical protein